MLKTFRKPVFLALTTLALLAAVAGRAAAQPATEIIGGSPPRPDPLAQIRAEHVMLSTADYDGTIAWYRDNLGFQVIHEWTVPEFEGVRLAYMQLNGFIIEVVSTPDAFQEEKIPGDLVSALSDRGFGHLAFLAADVDAVAAELKSRGVKLVVPPTSFPDAGRRLIFVQDNNGNYIEFLTPLSAYADSSEVP